MLHDGEAGAEVAAFVVADGELAGCGQGPVVEVEVGQGEGEGSVRWDGVGVYCTGILC